MLQSDKTMHDALVKKWANTTTPNSVSVESLTLHFQTLHEGKDVKYDAARQRIYRWMKRRGLSVRRLTHEAQLGGRCNKVISDYQTYMNEQIHMLKIKQANIVNADQTNVPYMDVSRTTVSNKGAKTVSGRTIKTANRATAMLSVTGDGKNWPHTLFSKAS